MLAVGMKWNPSGGPGLAFVFYLIEDIWWYRMNFCAWAELGWGVGCVFKCFAVWKFSWWSRIAARMEAARAELRGRGRKLRGAAGAVRDRGGDHSLPDGDDSLRGDRRRSFITRDPVHHCTVPPVHSSLLSFPRFKLKLSTQFSDGPTREDRKRMNTRDVLLFKLTLLLSDSQKALAS